MRVICSPCLCLAPLTAACCGILCLSACHTADSGRLARLQACDMSAETYVRAVVPIGACFAGTLWLGNAAYLYLSVAFIQMLKVGHLLPADTGSWRPAQKDAKCCSLGLPARKETILCAAPWLWSLAARLQHLCSAFVADIGSWQPVASTLQAIVGSHSATLCCRL